MKAKHDKAYRLKLLASQIVVGVAILSVFAASAAYPQSRPADSKATDQRAVEDTSRAELYKTFYLTNGAQQNDLNDIQTTLRNMLTRAKLYAVPGQNAIAMRASADDLQMAQQIISELDRTRKIYRLTYTITESDAGKPIGIQHYSLIVASGGKTNLKQGSKVPLLTGTASTGSNPEVTYLDVGLDIEAGLDTYHDGVRLRSKVNQSSVAAEKGVDVLRGDPVIRQTTLEGSSNLVLGKPQLLGSLDIPGSTRHQEIEVVSELVR